MKSSLEFLQQLKQNNNREWFADNKSWFQKSSDEFKTFTNHLILGINNFDDFVGIIDPKDCIFRIYRDVRFSPNKEPYKTNFGAYISKGGRKGIYAGYYFHLDAESSFASGGIYMAEPDVMKQIREDIEIYSDEFLAIVNDKKFASTFSFFENEKLKRVPQGFDKDSPMAEFLKFKHITPYRTISDKEICSNNLLKTTLDIYKTLKPLNDFLNRSVSGLEEQ
ncbi:MAG: DUF2461 domain-containing protein [Tenuifilaceae bacterium]